MMINRDFIALIIISAALLVVGCGRVGPSTGEAGDLALRVSVDIPETKASAQEGEQFTNLLVVTKDYEGVIQHKYVELSASSDFTNVVFEGLATGMCTVYAFANIEHTAWLADGSDISNIKEGGAVDEDMLMAVLSGADVPGAVPEGGVMLLTGKQEIEVFPSESNIGEVKLYRPVARLNVSLRNHTKTPVTLTDLSFSQFNADRTYLLPHRATSGEPGIPAGTTYRSLPSLSGAGIEVGAGASEQVYSTLLYENKAPEYRMMANVTLGGTSLSLGGGGGALLRFIDSETSQVTPVSYIRRNQDLTVVLNIYHGVISVAFDVQVYSDTWSGNGEESEHTFE